MIDVDSLLAINDFTLVRRSDISYNETFFSIDGFECMNEDAIGKKRIPNLSMNILGGLFKSNHVRFKAKNSGCDNWSGEKVSILNHREDFEILKEYCCIYINANHIHNKKIPYERDNNDKLFVTQLKSTDEKIDLILDASENCGQFKVNAKTCLQHNPLKLNYWHMIMKIFDVFSAEINNIKPAWTIKLSEQTITNIFSANATSRLQSLPLISNSFYLKK